ncbi:MAG: ribosomal-processing cysteine protease Prp [Bacillota bacterium]|nr:ribosomal-processing cysteine protease Prp [Bacillota bacterium]HHU61796.1 ribosomal-processing cysteine protease Prp [Natronincola sp.]
MTRIDFYKTDHGWQGFKAHGHTGFGVHGEDLVCAAVSALTKTSVLGLVKVLGITCKIEEDEQDGLLLCLLPRGLSKEVRQQAQLILKVLYEGLTTLELDYGKYIAVKEVPYHEN